MAQYEDFVRHVFANGGPKADRTGTGTVSVFGYQMRFDLSEGFPLVTTKKVHFKSIAYELLWFLRGDRTSAGCRSTASRSGTSGPTRTASSAPSTACSGGAGRRRTAATRPDRRSRAPAPRRIPIRAGSSSAPGTSPTSRGWRWPRAMPSSSSTWPTASGSRASSTSAARTSSSASRSTSRATRC